MWEPDEWLEMAYEDRTDIEDWADWEEPDDEE
jgi:hypothetical protein